MQIVPGAATGAGDWEGAIFAVAAVACRRTKGAVFAAYAMLSALPWEVRSKVPMDAWE